MDFDLRENRRKEAARVGRKRLLATFVLVLLAHAAGLPLLVLSFTLRPAPAPVAEPEVSMVRIPAAAWDANMGAARNGPAAKLPEGPIREKEKAPEPPKPEEKKPEKPPGQVVETAPGNGKEDPDAKLAAETSNQVEKETISRDRRPGAKVTMPRETTTQRPPESPPQQQPGEKGDGVAIGDAGDGKDRQKGEAGTKIEIPSTEKREKLALKQDPHGPGNTAVREESEEIQGNSDRFRLQTGQGEGDSPNQGLGGMPGTGAGLARLFPSQATLDRIAGAPAPDHVEGMEEGEGTFLNTREWKYASFFNRLKSTVAENWNPGQILRQRDPTGDAYAWKDRHTLLQITLRADGRLDEVTVARSSGVDFLDREAIAAFERAQPFPNPPRGLAEPDGRIHFQFGFYLEVGRGRMQWFR